MLRLRGIPLRKWGMDRASFKRIQLHQAPKRLKMFRRVKQELLQQRNQGKPKSKAKMSCLLKPNKSHIKDKLQSQQLEMLTRVKEATTKLQEHEQSLRAGSAGVMRRVEE
jgi:hypothetical protein